MLQLSSQQLAALGEQSFADRFRALLLETDPEQASGIPEPELKQQILAEARKAAEYGLVSEQAAATFVMTAWLLGPGFDGRYPAVREQLTNGRLSEQQKAQWLESFTLALLKALET